MWLVVFHVLLMNPRFFLSSFGRALPPLHFSCGSARISNERTRTHRSPCECIANGTQATTANPGRPNGNSANTTPAMLASTGQTVPCTCANQMIGGGNAFNMNAGGFDGSALNSGDPLLSSNAKFQAISAIAVSQDGVINVADQGKFSRSFPNGG